MEARNNCGQTDIFRLVDELDLGRVQFVEEKVSGKISWRKRRVTEILDELGKGDLIIVSELSRLGRSMFECMEILSVAFSKGVSVCSVKGKWKLDNSI